ncbi:hypothetical protein EXIGLDRAFT_745265 [Exidia glandulosa HHB12029]|uniref:Mid2 domain-containing protein n=1 Tax=Exidia glandulosa HHB12029 TaxID=1314781 RepID=A0A165NPM3_EXIGL|nr:hypothetical protein EXIGLDRAFT_745265 [Exidia glandulosa HHB12029]
MRFAVAMLALAVSTAAAAQNTTILATDRDKWRASNDVTLEAIHGVGCARDSQGFSISRPARIELVFNGADLQLFGQAPSLSVELFMDDEPYDNRIWAIQSNSPNCMRLAAWDSLDAGRAHNLTILLPAATTPLTPAFVVANATAIANVNTNGHSITLPVPVPDPSSSSSSSPASASPSSTSTQATPVTPSGTHLPADSESPTLPPPEPKSHAVLIIGVVLGSLALFFAVGFAFYAFFRRRRTMMQDTLIKPRSRRRMSRRRMVEAEFVMVTSRQT